MELKRASAPKPSKVVGIDLEIETGGYATQSYGVYTTAEGTKAWGTKSVGTALTTAYGVQGEAKDSSNNRGIRGIAEDGEKNYGGYFTGEDGSGTNYGVWCRGDDYSIYAYSGDTKKATSGGDWDVYSDQRIKTNIVGVSGSEALGKINSLALRKYNYTDAWINGPGATTQSVYGFIAQEVEETGNFNDGTSVKTEPYRMIVSHSKFRETGSDGKIETTYIDDDYLKDPELKAQYTSSVLAEYEDFKGLNTSQIWRLNVGATQELHRLVASQSNQIIALQNRVTELEG
jgi:hypothetical protein